ncbi:MAG: hypothetical protein HFI86_00015 [Bacilli bacterium]|nr:hypothetical protein [Bacilli bacterium]
MDEFDLLCNFDDFYLSIKDIIIDEILKYHDIEEQERIKKRFNQTLILFYDEDKEKDAYLSNLISIKHDELIKKLFDKFRIEYNDENFYIKQIILNIGSLDFAPTFDEIFDKQKKDDNHKYQQILKKWYTELDLKIDNDDENLYNYFKAMNDYRLTLANEFNNYKKYIYTRYNKIYRQQENLAIKQNEICITLYKEFIKFLLDNALVNNKDKEQLKVNGIANIQRYMDLWHLELFVNDVYSDFGFKVGGIDFIKANKYDKNLEKTKDYLNSCGINNENLDKKIDTVLEFRESLRNKYLLSTLGELPEIKKIFKKIAKFYMKINTLGFNDELSDDIQIYFLKNLILDDNIKLHKNTSAKNKVCCMGSNQVEAKILKCSPLDSVSQYCNYIEALIHEMIHISDNASNIGILDEILVEKLAWKIYNSIIERILAKYPYLKLDALKNMPTYNKLFSLVGDFVDENFDILLKGKESGNIEYFYEKFGKDNFDAFTNYINEKYELMCQYNLSSEQLLEQKDNIDEIKDNMRNYLTNNNHKHK